MIVCYAILRCAILCLWQISYPGRAKDVGYTSRVQCGAPMAGVYPGTMFAVDVEDGASDAHRAACSSEVWIVA